MRPQNFKLKTWWDSLEWVMKGCEGSWVIYFLGVSPSWREMLTGFLRDRTTAKQQDEALSLSPPWSTVLISCLRCASSPPPSPSATLLPLPRTRADCSLSVYHISFFGLYLAHCKILMLWLFHIHGRYFSAFLHKSVQFFHLNWLIKLKWIFFHILLYIYLGLRDMRKICDVRYDLR